MTTCIQSKTEYDCNTITKQMGFRRKSNDLFEYVSHLIWICIPCFWDILCAQNNRMIETFWVPTTHAFVQKQEKCFFCYALFTKDLWDDAELFALDNKEVPRRIKVLIVILVKEILLYTCIGKSLLEPLSLVRYFNTLRHNVICPI